MLAKYGPIEDITILQNYHTGKSKGCGFIKFCYRDDAIKAFLVRSQSSLSRFLSFKTTISAILFNTACLPSL